MFTMHEGRCQYNIMGKVGQMAQLNNTAHNTNHYTTTLYNTIFFKPFKNSTLFSYFLFCFRHFKYFYHHYFEGYKYPDLQWKWTIKGYIKFCQYNSTPINQKVQQQLKAIIIAFICHSFLTFSNYHLNLENKRWKFLFGCRNMV